MSKLNIKSFIFDNHEKFMTFQVYFYSAVYRIIILKTPENKKDTFMGRRCTDEIKETPAEITEEEEKYARLVSFHVNRVTLHTPWESLCLVRALTASKLLMKKGINSTMYLGVKNVDGKMDAHAWLRCGTYFVTGGTGQEYACVAKFVRGNN